MLISAGDTSAQFMFFINRSGAEFPYYISESKQCAQFSIPAYSGGKLERDVIAHTLQVASRNMRMCIKVIRWFLVEASLPQNCIIYMYCYVCIAFTSSTQITLNYNYTLHSTHVTLEDAQCCFLEANVTTASCNVIVSGLSLPTAGMHTLSLMLEPTNHNLVCDQSLLAVTISEFIMIVCVCRTQWNLSILDTVGTQLAVLYREVSLTQK